MEVYFETAWDQTPIRPGDFIRYYEVHISIDGTLICVVLVIGLIGVIVPLRRKQDKAL
ncbi:MAG: hypothetical protein HYR84_02295 [Planctomycetes bacterium]|nr:hypothetical protein [Planctomycetota bacterium]